MSAAASANQGLKVRLARRTSRDGRSGSRPRSRSDSEGSGDEVFQDSSEEEEEDEEEERRVRDGFIVDTIDDDDDEGDGSDGGRAEVEESRSERRKRRKERRRAQKARQAEDDDVLDEDDLDLIQSSRRPSNRRRSEVDDEASDQGRSPKRSRAALADIFDDQLDDLLEGSAAATAAARSGRRRNSQVGELDDFIEEDYEDEEAQADEAGKGRVHGSSAGQRLRRPSQSAPRRSIAGFDFNVGGAGIDDETWQEFLAVFGDGTQYEYAQRTDLDDEDTQKAALRKEEVFEPSEIRQRFLSGEDDTIRETDWPERFQLHVSSISTDTVLATVPKLLDTDMAELVASIKNRIGRHLNERLAKYEIERPDLAKEVESAISVVVYATHKFGQEIPFIWNVACDTILHFDPNATGENQLTTLLELPDLWRIYDLSVDWLAMNNERLQMKNTFESLGIVNPYFTEHLYPVIATSQKGLSDIYEWLNFNFSKELRDMRANESIKRPAQLAAVELFRDSILSEFIKAQRALQEYTVSASELAQNILSNYRNKFTANNPQSTPEELAANYCIEGPLTPESVLQSARSYCAQAIGVDPLIRQKIRDIYKREGLLSVTPTDKGKAHIDQTHIYFNFKYLEKKPISKLSEGAQFLYIMQAVNEGLVQIQFDVPKIHTQEIERLLQKGYGSDAQAGYWDDERNLIIMQALSNCLLPDVKSFLTEHLIETQQTSVLDACAAKLYQRVNMSHFRPPKMLEDDIPSVLAISNNAGQRRDRVFAVMVSSDGQYIRQLVLDDLREEANKQLLQDFIQENQPQVVAMVVTEILDTMGHEVPIVWPSDETARLYFGSERAVQEYGTYPPIVRFAVAIARYVQNPVLEYAALGKDLIAVKLDAAQDMVPRDKLLVQYERILVDVINKMGVDINRAVKDLYYRHLLPFVAGLGPRKAIRLIDTIQTQLDGHVVSRDQLMKVLSDNTSVMHNAFAFLEIPFDKTEKLRPKKRNDEGEIIEDHTPSTEPLDATRIHALDYDLARKMAAGAAELDPEDYEHEHLSYPVAFLMNEDDMANKLQELSLEDYAITLYKEHQERKRQALENIRRELIDPYADRRDPFTALTPPQLFQQLSGETSQTLNIGFIVPVSVICVLKEMVIVKLDSGVDGFVNLEGLSDIKLTSAAEARLEVNQKLRAYVQNIDYDQCKVELSLRASVVSLSDDERRRIRRDDFYDTKAFDVELKLNKYQRKATESDRISRVIDHPDFHPFNWHQTRDFLADRTRGEAVIRPSSKSTERLTISWKVDDDCIQNIDVEELGKTSAYTVGNRLKIGEAMYSDLDDILVSHIKPMVRLVAEIQRHERYHGSSREELAEHLNQAWAIEQKPVYAFALHREKPGYFWLGFKASGRSDSLTFWPIRVLPGSFEIAEKEAGSVHEIITIFKIEYQRLMENAKRGSMTGAHTNQSGARSQHRSMISGRTPSHNFGGRTPGAQTPNHARGGRTPGNRTPGGRTPGRRTPGGRTPNHPDPSDRRFAFADGNATPNYMANGADQRPRTTAPAMHPSRMALLQKQ